MCYKITKGLFSVATTDGQIITPQIHVLEIRKSSYKNMDLKMSFNKNFITLVIIYFKNKIKDDSIF